ARRAGAARPSAGQGSRTPYRGLGRHAGARPPRRGISPRPGRADRRQRHRPRLLCRPADARTLGNAAGGAPRRLRRDLRRARSRRARHDPGRRRRHGQRVAGIAHGPDRRGADAPISRSGGRRAGGRTRLKSMLYFLTELSDKITVLNVFRYITFRTGGAVVTALVFVFLFGPSII